MPYDEIDDKLPAFISWWFKSLSLALTNMRGQTVKAVEIRFSSSRISDESGVHCSWLFNKYSQEDDNWCCKVCRRKALLIDRSCKKKVSLIFYSKFLATGALFHMTHPY